LLSPIQNILGYFYALYVDKIILTSLISFFGILETDAFFRVILKGLECG
jgi:hypothetical protein